MARLERVLIVGAGLAGLCLARALRSSGCEVELIERRAHAEAPGAGILLTGNALRALSQLGVGEDVLAAGRRIGRVRFTDADERELFAVDVGGAAQPDWPPFVSIAREALLRILLALLANDGPPVAPRLGTTLASLAAVENGVAASLSDGTRGVYSLVVGADGVHSQLRTQLFGGAPAQPIAGFCGWRFLAPCPTRLTDPQYMLGNGRTLLLHPLPGGEVYCGAGPVSESGLLAGSELERLRAAFADFGGVAREVLQGVSSATALIPTRYWHIAQRPWHRGRCVLIGDAAHACAPTLAQGGALAFEDVAVLTELLASELEVEAALAAFEARRAPRVEYAQSASLARMQANQPRAAHALAVRDAVLARVGGEQLTSAWAKLMREPA